MQAILLISEYGELLDAIAIVCSLLVILFLMLNRRKHGRFILNGKPGDGQGSFSREVSLQMISQQSQKAYANLQRSLSQEFEALQQLESKTFTSGFPIETASTLRDRNPSLPGASAKERHLRFRHAKELLADGADEQLVQKRCGLGVGELELVRGLRQFAQEVRP